MLRSTFVRVAAALVAVGLLVTVVLDLPEATPQVPRHIVLFSSAARTVTTNSADQTNPREWRGLLLFLSITAASGTTPTLDITVQVKDPTSEIYVAIPGAAFAQKTTTGTDTLMLYPGIGETANREVSVAIGTTWRVVATIAGTTPSFTFSLTADYLP